MIRTGDFTAVDVERKRAPEGKPPFREDLRATALLHGEDLNNLPEHFIGECAEVEISPVSTSIVGSRSGIGRCRRRRSRTALAHEGG